MIGFELRKQAVQTTGMDGANFSVAARLFQSSAVPVSDLGR
jgi:hypothetical protein